MGKNVKIVVLFTVIFLIAIITNTITASKKVDNRNVTIYSDISGNKELTKKIDTIIRSNNMEANIIDDSSLKSDIKVKYLIMISDDERQDYDILNIHDENIYAVTAKDVINNTNYENVQNAIISANKHIDNTLIVFSSSTFKWFAKYTNRTNNEAYSYGYLPEILGQDKTIIGIAFDSEIPDKKGYNFKRLSNNTGGGETFKDTLCLLIKKGRLDTKISNDIVSELRKG